MAEGGGDIETTSTQTITVGPEDEDYWDYSDIGETSFSNSGDKILTGETDNLSTDDTFKSPETPDGATAEGATRNKMIYVTSREDYTNVTKEDINKALLSSRTRQETTAEGIENMINQLSKKDGHFYLLLEGADYKTRGYKLTYKEQGNKIVKFYAYSRLKGDYGKDIAELVELLFTDLEGFTEECMAMSFELTDQISQKDEADRKRREEWEHGAQNEPTSETIRQQQTITPNINRIFNDSSTQTPKQVIDKLIDVPEEELKAFGFTDHAIGELRGMNKACESIASVKRFKDVTLGEIDNQLKELHEQFLSEDDPFTKVKIGERIVEVENHRKEEAFKIQQLFTEEESQFQRMKRLITDVLKKPDSPVPERLMRLYKVEGLTLAFAIAAITMFFATLGLAISNSLRGKGGGGGGGGGKPPKYSR